MPALSFAYPVSAIRAAEQPLLDVQSQTDELMRQAAHAVAIAAQTMLSGHPVEQGVERVLLLVGSGGNGGDGLYAGAALANAGYPVDALLLGKNLHEDALTAFQQSGGNVMRTFPVDVQHYYRLVIDAIVGIGGSGGLRREVAQCIEPVHRLSAAVLSVDLPSGVDADSGLEPAPYEIDGSLIPAHISADVTVTFGGLRYAHVLSSACGEVIATNASVMNDSVAGGLSHQLTKCTEPIVFAARAMAYRSSYEWPPMFRSPRPRSVIPVDPRPKDNKYTLGVVGICAGSGTYPGAAVLTTRAAVRATSSMVRFVGDQALEVVRQDPEVVACESLEQAGRVQTWVVGPGRGVGEPARAELEELLSRPEPLLIDADALTLLAKHRPLRVQLSERQAATVLTPHAEEFRRLAKALNADGKVTIPELADDPIGAIVAMATALHCAVVLKGRFTLIAYPTSSGVALTSIDAGSSWAATPGSGDVLAGLMGARIAFSCVDAGRRARGTWQLEGHDPAYLCLVDAVQIHGMAAWLSAQTPDGPAATSASRIAKYIPRATARLTVY